MNAQSKIAAAEPATGFSSEELTAPHVYVAMSMVMEAIGKVGISKDRRNKDQGYNFRGIDDIYNDLNGLMAANRLLMLPVKMISTRSEKPTKSGGTVNYTQLTVDFKMVSAFDGSSEVIQTVGEAMDSADKSSNKAQSAAMKYATLMVFMIPTEGDNDADATTHELAATAPQTRNTTKGAEAPKVPTLAERKAKLEAAMRAQKSKPDLIKAYRRGSGLCADLDLKDPEGLAEIEQLYTKLLNGFDAPDFEIGPEEIPF